MCHEQAVRCACHRHPALLPAGANTCANERDLRYQIREAGFIPQQRDILYNYIDRPDIDDVDKSDSMKLKQLSVAFAD